MCHVLRPRGFGGGARDVPCAVTAIMIRRHDRREGLDWNGAPLELSFAWGLPTRVVWVGWKAPPNQSNNARHSKAQPPQLTRAHLHEFLSPFGEVMSCDDVIVVPWCPAPNHPPATERERERERPKEEIVHRARRLLC